MRPPVDIQADIETFIRNYAPLRESRPHLHTRVDEGGHVTLSGNVVTEVVWRVLVDSVRQVEGVTAVDAAALYDDKALMTTVGRMLPPGVYVTAYNGVIVLSGKAPAAVKALEAKIMDVPGVRHVKSGFYATAKA